MKIVLFYDNEMYVEKWKCIMDCLLDQDSTTVTYTSLFDHYKMEDNFFSLFLLTPHQAASMPLLEKVKALMKSGAHEKSMLFIINDKDRVSIEEREVITTEICKTLKKYILSPEILWTSSHGYHLYQTFKKNHEDNGLKRELRYTYWNAEGEPLTLQDMMKNQEMSLVIEDSGIPALTEVIENRMLLSPQRAKRRDPSKKHVLLLGDNRLISDALAEQDNLVIHKVETFNQLEQEAMPHDLILIVTSHEKVELLDYEKLNSFSSVTVLIDGGNQRNVWEIHSDEASQLTVKHPYLKFIEVCSYYVECLKLKKTPKELIEDPFIVIRDQHGFPLYKVEISDWDEALLNESGIPNVIKAIS